MNKKITLIVVALLAAGIIASFALIGGGTTNSGPGPNDDFAKCLTSKGMKFFGAFWCPHCQAMKKLFGSSMQYINYVECSNTDGSQNKTCTDAGIKGYPTWRFTDGSELSGEVTFDQLSQKTSCQLPGGAATSPAVPSSGASSPAK